ncbi:hypothetical protein PIB30_094558, partial [Stylosanthes scabra]|nr:hypothetical protein [Stylosanthes scabra]
LLLDPLILVGSILQLIVVYYLIRFGILAEIVGLLKIRITCCQGAFHAYAWIFYAYAWMSEAWGREGHV